MLQKATAQSTYGMVYQFTMVSSEVIRKLRSTNCRSIAQLTLHRQSQARQQVWLSDEHCTSGLHNGATSSIKSSSSTTSAPMMCLYANKPQRLSEAPSETQPDARNYAVKQMILQSPKDSRAHRAPMNTVTLATVGQQPHAMQGLTNSIGNQITRQHAWTERHSCVPCEDRGSPNSAACTASHGAL